MLQCYSTSLPCMGNFLHTTCISIYPICYTYKMLVILPWSLLLALLFITLYSIKYVIILSCMFYTLFNVLFVKTLCPIYRPTRGNVYGMCNLSVIHLVSIHIMFGMYDYPNKPCSVVLSSIKIALSQLLCNLKYR